MFRKGEYIIANNYIYKQRKDSLYLMPSRNINNKTGKTLKNIIWNKSNFLIPPKNFRYATREEIKRYDRELRPFDITSKEIIPDTSLSDILWDLEILQKRINYDK